MRVPGIPGLRVHRPAAGDRRTGGAGADAVSSEPVPGCAVPVLRAAKGSDQGAVLGGRWVCAAVQAAGERELSMAEERR